MTDSERLDKVSELALELVTDNKLLWMAITALCELVMTVKGNVVVDIPRTQADWQTFMESKKGGFSG